MDRPNVFLAVVLCVIVTLLYFRFVVPPPPQPDPDTAEVEGEEGTSDSPTGAEGDNLPPKEGGDPEDEDPDGEGGAQPRGHPTMRTHLWRGEGGELSFFLSYY